MLAGLKSGSFVMTEEELNFWWDIKEHGPEVILMLVAGFNHLLKLTERNESFVRKP